MKRINSIDFTRGTVMIIMALDHVRDLIHVDSLTQSPTDLNTTTPLLFMTRWVTHLCAPIFVFLAGSSAFLSFQKKQDAREFRSGLMKRGLWLVLLDFTLVNFAIYFDWKFNTMLLGVLAAIGFGFIVLSFLFQLKIRTIGMIGLIIIFLHNLTPLIPFPEGSIVRSILSPLFQTVAFPLMPGKIFIVGYPLIPWLGIMLTGFAAGPYFLKQDDYRKKLFVKIGLGALLFFLILRITNFYGDPVKWTSQKNEIFTFLSFINITKYPPSLLFCLATLGIMLLILAFSENARGSIPKILQTFGRVPLFYFIVHFYLIHFILIAVMLLQGFHWSDLEFNTGTFGRPKDQASGLTLPYIFLIWGIVVLIMYKPCQWFSRFKSK